MSSIRKHPRSPFWYAVIRKVTGVWTNVSTKMRKREDAKRFALDMQRGIDEAIAGRLVESQARKVISEAYQTVNQRALPSATIGGYWGRWLEAKDKECKPNTMNRYRAAHGNIMRYLNKRAEWEITHLDKQLITDYRDHEAKRTSVAAANMNVKILRCMLNDAFSDGLVTINEADKVKAIKRDTNARFRRLPFTAEQIKQVLGLGTLTQEWRGMVLMGLYTGQRLGDIAIAKWGQLDLVNKVWAFTSGKTGRNMIIPIHPALLAHLHSIKMKAPTADDPLFPRANDKVVRTGKTGQLSKEFHDILSKVGLAKHQSTKGKKTGRDSKRDMSPLSFHSLRGTMTSLLKSQGASQGVAMDIVGHDTPSVSDHYTTISEDVKREWIDKLPDFTA
jgi:integrase